MSRRIEIKGECLNFSYKAYPLKDTTRWVIKIKLNGHWVEVVQIENASLIIAGFGHEKEVIETLITETITNLQELLKPKKEVNTNDTTRDANSTGLIIPEK